MFENLISSFEEVAAFKYAVNQLTYEAIAL